MKRLLSIVLLAAAAGCGDSAASPDNTGPMGGGALLAHLEYLADDSLYGRGSTTPQEEEAAEYIAAKFAEYGLQPGAGAGYIQDFGLGLTPGSGPQSRNVIGVLPGAGRLTTEWIVVGAHYDHVGWHQFPDSIVIYNGADDNASGTAMLLEAARYFGELYSNGASGNRRSMMFHAYGAEELGLHGSYYFCDNPTVPMSNIGAMVNMDMVGRMEGSQLYLNGAFSSEAWRFFIEANNDDLQLVYVDDVLYRTDHVCFWEAGKPVMTFHTGLHEDYHEPTDDVELINLEGMVRIGNLVLGVLDDLAIYQEQVGFTAAEVTIASFR
jgi:hypothetical protein